MKTTSDSDIRQQKKLAGKRPHLKDAAMHLPIPDEKTARLLKPAKALKCIL